MKHLHLFLFAFLLCNTASSQFALTISVTKSTACSQSIAHRGPDNLYNDDYHVVGNGSVIATVTGGTLPYTYYYLHGNDDRLQNNGYFSELIGDSPFYSFLSVWDATGLRIDTSFDFENTVSQPQYLNYFTLNNLSSCSSSDYSMVLYTTGGTPPLLLQP